MRNSLRTRDRLTQWDVGVNTDLSLICCALCDSQPDSHAYLFFECPFSTKVWSYVRGLTGMDFVPPNLHDILLYLHPICNKRTALSVFGKLILAASSYYIWLERNNRLFKKGKRSPEEIRDIIIVTVRLKLTTFRFKKTAMGPKGERLSLVWLFSWKNWKMFDSVDMKTYELAYRLRLGNFRYVVVPAIEKARLYRVFFSKLVSGYVKSDISHKRIQIYSQDYGYILRVVDDPLD
ncbi:hypothetical protein Tco_1308595 [Tanacetum coccineum]